MSKMGNNDNISITHSYETKRFFSLLKIKDI